MEKIPKTMAMPDMLILPNREMNIAYAKRKQYTQCTCTMDENSEGQADDSCLTYGHNVILSNS